MNDLTHAQPDLSICDREPIHIPGSIQPHGVLLVLDPVDLLVLQASSNTEERLGMTHQQAVGQPLSQLLGSEHTTQLWNQLQRAPLRARPALLGSITLRANHQEQTFHAVAHQTDGGLILELELAQPEQRVDIHPLVDAFTLQSEAAQTLAELAKRTALEVRRLTGFDRVLIYQFDEDWNGNVIGEDGSGRLPQLLNHRFPASDIPAQARELYRQNRVRIIPDASYRPVPVHPTNNPVTSKPLDMTFSILRSVSPVHVEYMRNMQTASSMSVSILRDGRLWGLIACHHQHPLSISFPVRAVCDLYARAFSLRLSALEHASDFERRLSTRSAFARLLERMTESGNFAKAMTDHAESVLSFTESEGAAIVTAEGCTLLGHTPTQTQVLKLTDWLYHEIKQDVYSSDSLSSVFPPAADYVDSGSGVLAIAISKLHPSYILWFRPEVIQTIKWGGNPNKPIEALNDQVRIHPRRSFETWKEIVRNRSHPWTIAEVEGAAELRNTIVGNVLRKAEELAALNDELTRSNKELEAFSYSVSHDLRAPLRHIVGYAEMLREEAADKLTPKEARCIATIIESSEYAGRLVDKLLNFSRLGRAELQCARVNMNSLIEESRINVVRDAEDRTIEWRIADLPAVHADLMMLRMAVQDLLSNAVKYTRERDRAVIQINYQDRGSEFVFSIEDNGVGFDMEYADKLFGVFQRLHRWEDYEGTGIGLANVRRVIERHGGKTWAFGEEDVGATFYFSLPKPIKIQ